MRGAIDLPVSPVFFMKTAAFLAQGPSVRMRAISRLLPPSFRALFPSSVHKLRRWRARSLHSRRMCLTDWFPCLHSHLPSSIPGALRWKRNSRRPIFPVRICTTSELSSLLSPIWSLTVPFLGTGSSLCSSRPRRSLVHSSLHSLIAYLVNWVFFADSSSFTRWALVAVDRVSSSLTPPRLSFFNLQPVASFADLSAASLPRRPIWAGTQW